MPAAFERVDHAERERVVGRDNSEINRRFPSRTRHPVGMSVALDGNALRVRRRCRRCRARSRCFPRRGLSLSLRMMACSRPPPPTTMNLHEAVSCRCDLSSGAILVVEQPHAGEGHRNAIFVAGFDDVVVADRAARLRRCTARRSCGRARCCRRTGRRRRNPSETPVMLSSHARFSSRVSGSGFSVKNCCPYAVGQHVHLVVGDIDVDRVVPVGTADVLLKRAGRAPSDAGAGTRCRPCCRQGACSGCGSAGPRRRRWPGRPWRSTPSWTGCI